MPKDFLNRIFRSGIWVERINTFFKVSICGDHRTRLNFKKYIYLALFTFLLTPIFVLADITPEINYQAKLMDTTNSIVADDTYSVTFRLYTSPGGPTPVWEETTTVTTINGLFSVLLGQVNSLNAVNFNQALYLGVEIENDGEMTPRKRLGSVPSAFTSRLLNGMTSDQFVHTSTTTLPNITTLSNLNTVSTITSGTWQGSPIGVTFGGTGTSTAPTFGQLLMGNTSGGYDLVATSSLGITGSGGTVTSVALSAPTGFTVSGSPITTDGTLSFNFASGYEPLLSASSTNWNNFFNTPSTRITAGTNLTWSGNTLNALSYSDIRALFSGTSPITYNNTTGAIGFDFSTNNTWTGGNIFSTATITSATTTNLAVTGSFNFLGTTITNVATWFAGLFDSNFAGKTTTDLTEGTNLYYTDERVNTFIAASSTIPKTYSANTWTGTQSIASTLFNLTGLADGCIEISSGLLTSTGSNCGTGSGGISSLNSQTGSSQTFATSTSGGLVQTITSTGNVHTWTLGVASGYDLPLTASTTEWSSFFNTPSTRITAGTNLTWNGNTLNFDGILPIASGGTGTSTAPALGQLLMGNASGGYDLVSTSTLGISGSNWTLSGSDIYRDTGNVGIGTTTPFAKLTVDGEVAFQGTNFATTTIGSFDKYFTVQARYLDTPDGITGAPVLYGYADISPFDVNPLNGVIINNTMAILEDPGLNAFPTLLFAANDSPFTDEIASIVYATSTGFLNFEDAQGYVFDNMVGVNGDILTTGLLASRSTTTSATTTNLAVTNSFDFLGTTITNVGTWFAGLFDSNLATKDTDDLAEGSNLYFTDARAITALTGQNISIFNNDAGYTTNAGTVTSVGLSAPTGFTVSNSPVTGAGTLTLGFDTGYEALLSASSTAWNTFYNTPSNRITAGTNLTWSGNTLNFDGILPIASGGTGTSTAPALGQLLMGNASGGYDLVATSSLGIDSSNWTLSGSDIYRNTGNVGIGTTTPLSKLTVEGDVTFQGTNFATTIIGSFDTYLSIEEISLGGAELFPMLRGRASDGLSTLFAGNSFGLIDIDNEGSVSLAFLANSGAGILGFDGTTLSLFDPESLKNLNLSVTGNLSADYFTTSSTTATSTIAGNLRVDNNLQIGNSSILLRSGATSTFDGSINLTAGCFAINGTCLDVGGISSNWTLSGDDVYREVGNVGIGTTSPLAKLHVDGEVAFQGTNFATTTIGSFESYLVFGTGPVLDFDGAPFLFPNNKILGLEGVLNIYDREDSELLSGLLFSSVNSGFKSGGGLSNAAFVSYSTTSSSLNFSYADKYVFDNDVLFPNFKYLNDFTGNQQDATRAIKIVGDYLHVLSYASTTDTVYRIYDIGTDPENPTLVSPLNIANLPIIDGSGTGIDVKGNYAYLSFFTSTSTDVFRIVDISDPADPQVVSGGSLSFPGGGGTLVVNNDYVYMTSVGGEVHIVDVSDPNSPSIESSISTPSALWTIKYKDDHVFIGGRDTNSPTDTFRIIDVSDPSDPIIVGGDSLDLGEGMWTLDVKGDYVYVAAGGNFTNSDDHKFLVIDVSDKSNPQVVSSLFLGRGPSNYVRIIGNYAYVTRWFSDPFNFYVIDISDPLNIGIVTQGVVPTFPLTVDVYGEYIYTGHAPIAERVPPFLAVHKVKTDRSFYNIAQSFNSLGDYRILNNTILNQSSLSLFDTNTATTSWTVLQRFGNDLSILPGLGNVGIGTTTPLAKLHVDGSFRADYFIMSSTTSTSTIAGNLRVDNNLQIGNSSILLRSGATSTFDGGINLTAGCFAINGTCLDVGGISSNWTLSGDDIYRETGNVGIGTTTPLAKLHVEGNTILNGDLFVVGTSTTNNANIGNLTVGTSTVANLVVANLVLDANACFGGNCDSAGFQFGNTGEYIYSPREDIDPEKPKWSLIFATQGLDRLFIDNAGRVAVGTTSPASASLFSVGANNQFQVDPSGNIIAGTWQGSPIGVTFGGTGTSTAPTFGQLLMGNTSGGYDLVATSSLGINSSNWTLSGDDIYRETGNVGIGTSTPLAKLHVDGSVAFQGTNFATTTIGDQNNFIRFSLETLSGMLGTINVPKISFSSIGNPLSDRFGLIESGFGIIPRENSGDDLAIAFMPRSFVNDGNLALLTYSTSTNSFMFSATASDPNFAILKGGPGDPVFGVNTGSELVSVFGNLDVTGSVGIGTTTPLAKLHVDGDVIFGSETAFGTTTIGRVGSHRLTIEEYTVSDLVTFTVPLLTGYGNLGLIGDIVGMGTRNNLFIVEEPGLGSPSISFISSDFASTFNVGSINYSTSTGHIHFTKPIAMEREGDGVLIEFYKDEQLLTGNNISVAGTTVSYNTTSDERLKENIVETSLGLQVLNQIAIKDFNWVNGNTDNIIHGLIAQELYDIYPQAVTKPFSEDGYWAVDYSKLTPLVVKSIQDLDQKLEDVIELRHGTFLSRLIAWLGDTANGITSFVADRIKAREELCVDDICVNRDDLLQIRELIDVGSYPPGGGGGVDLGEQDDEPDSDDEPIDDGAEDQEVNSDNTEEQDFTEEEISNESNDEEGEEEGVGGGADLDEEDSDEPALTDENNTENIETEN